MLLLAILTSLSTVFNPSGILIFALVCVPLCCLLYPSMSGWDDFIFVSLFNHVFCALWLVLALAPVNPVNQT